MKLSRPLIALILGTTALQLSGCASSQSRKPAVTAAVDGKTTAATDDELDEYADVSIPDPLEPVNRVTFWINHQLYTYLLRPISKGYEAVVPKPVRKGVYNAFDNVEYPVRFINHSLQGKFDRAGLETGKFVVNSTLGVGGLIRMSDKFPALADVPRADTAQTFAKWGIGPGFYFVIPVIGPSSARDTVGLAGDVGMNPVFWLGMFWGMWWWTVPVSVVDTTSTLPEKFYQYDAATKDALDRYLAMRSAYIQYRKQVNSR